MKTWSVVRAISGDKSIPLRYWIFRYESLPDGRKTHLCGYCECLLQDPRTVYLASSRGSPGAVGCHVCSQCDEILTDETPAGGLDDQVELVLERQQMVRPPSR